MNGFIKIEFTKSSNDRVPSMSSVLDDHLVLPSIMIWSVFGFSNTISQHALQDQVLVPILQELGRTPDRILLPSEGNSSIYVQDWAESLRIRTQVFQSDWARHGRIAQIVRDDRMQKECTHALVFLSSRSNKLEKMAEKMAKKGKVVFTSSTDLSLTQLVLPPETPSVPASTRDRKSNTQTTQPLLKFQS